MIVRRSIKQGCSSLDPFHALSFDLPVNFIVPITSLRIP
jgi:hypothetical protein